MTFWWRRCDPLRFPHNPSPSLSTRSRKVTPEKELGRANNSMLTSDRQALASPSEWLRRPVDDDHVLGEQQDIIEP